MKRTIFLIVCIMVLESSAAAIAADNKASGPGTGQEICLVLKNTWYDTALATHERWLAVRPKDPAERTAAFYRLVEAPLRSSGEHP